MARQFDAPMLGNIELFCHTAELASFTKAAMRAGVTQAAVSRAVSRVEQHVGVQLFLRSTRSVRLTERGRVYYEQCRQALQVLADAQREVSGDRLDEAGTVRCSLPTSYGHCRVLPVLAQFAERHPAIELHIQLTNRDVDLVGEGVDLAIRARAQPDSGLIARKLEDAALVIVASPAYLARHGTPRSLDELQGHRCIDFERPRTGQAVPWEVVQGGVIVPFTPASRVRIMDDILGVSAGALAGLGVAQTYRFVVAADLAAGRLVRLLEEHEGAARPFSLLYPGQRHMARRVRLLIDFLMEQLGPGSDGSVQPGQEHHDPDAQADQQHLRN